MLLKSMTSDDVAQDFGFGFFGIIVIVVVAVVVSVRDKFQALYVN